MQPQRAFTLVELSIVIVVIGLIAGGVMVGQSLVRASQVHSVSADVSRVRQAVGLFKEKYRYLPGDFPTATVVWGQVSASCTDATSTTNLTCNGNGDGKIVEMKTAGATAGYEGLRAWQHLANAGMMEGTYSGGPTVASQPFAGRVGVNYPSVGFSEASMLLMNYTVPAGDTNLYPINTDVIIYGKLTPNMSGVGYPAYPLLTPTEAESIDIKLDDGKPATGNVMAYKNGSALTPSCATTTSVTTADYSVTNAIRLCSLLFNLTITNQ